MKNSFNFDDIPTGKYRSGMYVTYCGCEYPADYLGVGRYILYSDTPDQNFTFPDNGRYIFQTDLRDEKLTCACNIVTYGVVRECYEHVTVHEIFENKLLISTRDHRLAFQVGLKPYKKYGFAGLIDRHVLIGIYEHRDYLWNPQLSICSTLRETIGITRENSWFVDKDRFTQLYVVPAKK